MNAKYLLVLDLDNTLFDCDGQMNGSYENINQITPFEGVSDVLSLPGVVRVLVSKGNPLIQRKKIQVLGLAHYFDEAFFPLTVEGKQSIFKALAEKYGKNVRAMYVVGDRIDCEIRYGNEFGFTTILMLHGKYASKLVPKDRFEKPDHAVKNFKELAQILFLNLHKPH